MPPLAFRLLGPLEVWRGDDPIRLAGDRQRALLALLLLRANELISSDELVDQLFGDDARAGAANALQAGISRLRRALADGNGTDAIIVTRGHGYVLESDPAQLDSVRFESGCEEGRAALSAGDAASSAEILRGALALWRGPALADVVLAQPQPEIARLDGLRIAATMDRIDAELALGRSTELVPELVSLVKGNPLQERLRGQLMLALYRAGRQAEALEVYRSTRRLLHDELGLEPSRALQRLERAILSQDASLERSAVCPFKGLAAFDAGDAAYFFGRERVVDELVACLARNGFAGIVGSSGSGKSSLLQAGLLPALRAGVLPASAGRRVVLMRPGPRPRLPDLGTDPVVLAVDQLEEAFTLCDDVEERAVFLDALADHASTPGGVLVVVAIRSDFYGRLAEHPRLASIVSRGHVLVGSLDRDELGRVIEQPAARAGLEVEPELTDALVADSAGQPGALPLLQTALLELWQHRDGTTLRLEHYRASGGAHGAVARLAEQAYATLDDAEQRAAHAILLQLSGGDSDAPVRRRVPLDELDTLDAATANALDALTDARLVTIDDGAVEVAHEALLREWPRLRTWLEIDREGRRLHARLAAGARDWEEHGCDPGVLYRGAPLAAALEWLADHAGEVTARERAFLDESRAAAEAEIERRRRANARLRRLLVLAAALLAVALVAAGLALEQRASARRAARVADARRLGAESLVSNPIDVALLLARQAWNIDPSPATRSTLLASLLRAPAALRVLHSTGDRMEWIDVSPNGATLAAGDNAGGIVLFDVRHRLHRRVLHVNGSPAADAFSPDGATLALGADAYVAFVDVATGRLHYGHYPAGWSSDSRIGYAPDGRALAGVEKNWTTHRARLVERDPRTFAVMRMTAQPWLDFVAAVRYSADGRLLVVSGGGGTGPRTYVYDRRTLRLLRRFDVGGFLTIASRGSEAATGGLDGSVAFLDLDGRRAPVIERQEGSVQGIGFSPDGKSLVTVGDGPDVDVWDVATRTIHEQLAGHSGRVFGPAFSPDGRTLYTSGLDGSVVAWDLTGTRRLGRAYSVVRAPVPDDRPDTAYLARAVAPDGRRFAIGRLDGSVAVVDAQTLQVTRSLQIFPAGVDVTALAYDRSGRRLAAGGALGQAVVVDAVTGDVVAQLPRPRTGATTALAFGPVLAAGGGDGAVRLLDAQTGRLLHTLHAAAASVQVTDVDVTRDGRRVLASTGDGFISVFDGVSGKRLWRKRADLWFATGARFSPDGRLVAVGGGQSGAVVFFDAATGRRDGPPIRAADGFLISVDFDRTGRTLATSGTDASARLWDVASRVQLGANLPAAHGGWVAATFFPDGRRLLAASSAGEGIVWDVDPAALARRACTVAGRNLTRAEWRMFLQRRRYDATCTAG